MAILSPGDVATLRRGVSIHSHLALGSYGLVPMTQLLDIHPGDILSDFK
jgi:hypothetical protein